MVTFIARLKIRPGKESAALDRLKEMVAKVRDTEPGALAYCCHLNEQNPLEVVFFETYADVAAKDAHMETPHLGRLLALIGDVLDPDFGVKIEDLQPVAGFTRANGV